jgi:hypothetical protein
MSSKGIKQNQGAIVNSNVVKSQHDQGVESRKAAHQKLLDDAKSAEAKTVLEQKYTFLRQEVEALKRRCREASDEITRLNEMVDVKEGTIAKLEGDNKAMAEKLNKAYGDQGKDGTEKTLPDVIEKKDLALTNKPATAKQLPVQEEEEVEEEEVKEEETEDEATA